MASPGAVRPWAATGALHSAPERHWRPTKPTKPRLASRNDALAALQPKEAQVIRRRVRDQRGDATDAK